MLLTAALASPLALLGMLMAMDRIQGRLEPGPAAVATEDEAAVPAVPDLAAA